MAEGTSSPFAPWMWPMMAADAFLRLAPNTLNQQVLPWNFILTVNEQNSTAPDTERRIVAEESYGRQLGRIMDALHELIREHPSGAKPNKAFRDFEELHATIQKIKCQAAVDELERVRNDLALLKTAKPKEYHRLAKGLRRILDADLDRAE